MKYNIEMMKIEAMAMKSFQNDVSQRPELAKELSSNTPMFSKVEKRELTSKMGSRFGEESTGSEESTVLVRGRERALETIAKKFEKKSKWLERTTAEGKTYYWNRETLGALNNLCLQQSITFNLFTQEIKWEAPKSGFLSLQEQQYCSDGSADPQPLSAAQVDPYGKWHTVINTAFDDKMPDLELPGQQLPEIVAPVVVEHQSEPRIEFKEKTIDSIKRKPFSGIKSEPNDEKVLFKKRKTDSKRNVRLRTDEQQLVHNSIHPLIFIHYYGIHNKICFD